MVLVAVHPWDIDGAARAGMRTAWLDRDGRPYPSYASGPTHRVRSLEELAGILTG
jgi:2-haloacid dehalogenase